jgi:hypothetical protein
MGYNTISMKQEIVLFQEGMFTARSLMVENGEAGNLFGKCRQASILTILALNELGRFDHLILLKSYSNREEKFNRDAGWSYHAVPLAGKDSYWFIGSGTNCDEGEEWLVGPLPLTDAIWELTEVEGCTWPDANSIEELVLKRRSEVYYDGEKEVFLIPSLVYDDGKVKIDPLTVKV